MGVSLPGGGGGKGGRNRSLSADLNLVPFIDLLSVCIVFLILTAVWTQISSLNLDQAVQDPNTPPPPPEEEPVPPMTVHLRSDGVWAGRNIETGQNFNSIGESFDWVGVEKFLTDDRAEHEAELDIVIVTDDGVEYQHMIAAFDLTRQLGYENTLLGGGPPSEMPLTSGPPPSGG